MRRVEILLRKYVKDDKLTEAKFRPTICFCAVDTSRDQLQSDTNTYRSELLLSFPQVSRSVHHRPCRIELKMDESTAYRHTSYLISL